ncbi:MAG: four helix bundle protein [Rubricoccaceae bacterium]|nr:four helix bundle protein [Rubricoccaceae bacterium]
MRKDGDIELPREMPIEIGQRTHEFALRSINLYRHLDKKERAARRLADQFLRSATSIGANIQEAKAGESRRDFVHKYGIALKEARETLYWVKLFDAAEFVESERLDEFIKEADEIVAVLTTIVRRIRENGLN